MIESFASFCPYCGEPVELMIDTSGGSGQQYSEDCPVCCRPWVVTVMSDHEGSWTAALQTEDE